MPGAGLPTPHQSFLTVNPKYIMDGWLQEFTSHGALMSGAYSGIHLRKRLRTDEKSLQDLLS
jgi:hypothetical protein